MGAKIIGILGGMGPEATADLYMRIIRATPVKRDQDHHRVIIDSNAKIPDRTPAILGTGPSPLPMMLETGLNLQRAGADFLIMPCNTAHHFHAELQKGLEIPVLHMIRLSAEDTRRRHPGVGKAGLLATDGTLASRLYHMSYGDQGIDIVAPSDSSQRDVMKAIYSHIKLGDLETGGKLLHRAAHELMAVGAEAVICGCTEVSLVLHDGDLTVPVVDPMQALAEKAIELARG
ncbi:amino acid racemase [Candidatus Bathyarchaeota archaeon]|nr:amino acid racemase [Candidatus Bathyarchaeota archaeon]